MTKLSGRLGNGSQNREPFETIDGSLWIVHQVTTKTMDNLVNILLQRNDSSVDWGFHLALDLDNQMIIERVEDGTMCSFYMSPGDAVLQVAGRSTKAMTIKKAQHLITQAGNAVEIIIKK
ncbi:PDZ domain-containing protein [Nephila pilipes]|uniref:PDZ domain-containing protein n=1 Tax=Nephila pilipes TaxID=299642 RepID=A0A8X6QJ90_NEPPI|nr:PDZ domain-containing protein [Nephila pilipes]